MPSLRVSGARIALAVCLMGWPTRSSAQQASAVAAGDGQAGGVTATLRLPSLAVEAAAIAGAAEAGTPRTPVMAPGVPARRPKALPALYASFGALQALDAASTYRALDRGASEANPVLKGIASNPGAMVAVKAASFASTVYLAERLWKKNRTAAVVAMTCVNAAYAVIVSHNYRAGRPDPLALQSRW